MCDHDDVTNLEKDILQASDCFVRYKCRHCKETVKKHATKDINFNRFYLRYYNQCIDHKINDVEIPTYKDLDGRKYCNWCGIEVIH
jgi:hypothetical protein